MEKRDRPDEAEVTPEMIEAGLVAYRRADPRFDLDTEIVANIFHAMEKAKPLQRS